MSQAGKEIRGQILNYILFWSIAICKLQGNMKMEMAKDSQKLTELEKLKAGGAKLPTHVAIIMDGNGRWAKKRGLPRVAG